MAVLGYLTPKEKRAELETQVAQNLEKYNKIVNVVQQNVILLYFSKCWYKSINSKFNNTTNFFIKVCCTSLTHIQKNQLKKVNFIDIIIHNKNNGIKEKIMVDMHIHTLYSDGDKTVEEVLKMCEEKKLEYISITDHNTTKQYGDEALEKKYFYWKNNNRCGNECNL